MTDFYHVDPATVKASSELNDWIAQEWMKWHLVRHYDSPCWTPEGGPLTGWQFVSDWFPSTNPAHAGEARRKSKWCKIFAIDDRVAVTIEGSKCEVLYSETNGDKDRAEALAICLAIVATLQAREDGI